MLSVGVLTLRHRFDTARCRRFVERTGLSCLCIGSRCLNFESDAGSDSGRSTAILLDKSSQADSSDPLFPIGQI